MDKLELFLSKDDINKIVSNLAQKISFDYKNKEDLIIIGILKGSFMFLADFVRYLNMPVKIDFIGVSSYGSSFDSSENIKLTKPLQLDVKNKNVLILEDIADTGLTLLYIANYLKSFGAKTVKLCALLDKKERRKINLELDYVGYLVKEGFLVGYGLDYAEKYRYLPEIYNLHL